MITRSIGYLLRGRTTPLQFFLTCILGAMLGFVPSFTQAPGLVICLTLLLLLFNTNLYLAAIVGLLCRFVGILVMPLTFQLGRMLLDGPTQGIFKALINAPVLAFFGFEYYTVTGGLLLGLIVGSAVGFAMVRTVRAFRMKMSSVEENSEKYKTWTAKWYVKVLLYIFAGAGKGKATYTDLLARRFGNPIRPLGAALVVLAVALLFILKALASGPIIAAALHRGLEAANGATVDIASSDIDLSAGKLSISGLAMADPGALDTDLLRAAKLEANLNTTNLLRKRIQIDNLVIADATHGEKRRFPGHLVGRREEPPDPPAKGNEKPLEEYIREAKVWKERLTQAREWLDKLSGPRRDPVAKKETLKERLDRQIKAHGYAAVAASHLIEGAPSLLITRISAEKVRTEKLAGETLDITGQNLSTHPNLVWASPRLAIKSSGGTIEFEADLGDASASPSGNKLRLACRNLPADRVAGALLFSKHPPMKGGTIDFMAAGEWSRTQNHIDFPLAISLHNTTLALPSGQSRHVSHFTLPVGLRGPLDRPRVTLDDEQLAKSLMNAGASELASKVREKAAKVAPELEEKGKTLIDNLFKK